MFQRILIPLDGSTRAERAIPVAVRIARASGAAIILLRVAATPLDEKGHRPGFFPLTRAVTEADIDAAAAYLTALTTSNDFNIALATHGRAGLQRLELGSVTWHLLGATDRPLLVVHPPAMASEELLTAEAGRSEAENIAMK